MRIDQENAVVNLTQNTGGTNALSPIGVLPSAFMATFQPLDNLLMIFKSSDWQVGRISSSFAVATTQLDSNNNWVSTPLVVLPNIYHVIVRSNSGVTCVIKAFLNAAVVPSSNIPESITPPMNDDSDKVATTDFVHQAIVNALNDGPF